MQWFEEYVEPEEISRCFEVKLVFFMMCTLNILTSQAFFQSMILRHIFPNFAWPLYTEALVTLLSIFCCTIVSIIADAFVSKLHIELVGSLLGLIFSLTMLIIEISVVHVRANVIFMLNSVLKIIQHTFLPTSICIFLQQLRFLNLSMQIEYLIAFAVWGFFAALTLFVIICDFTMNHLGIFYISVFSFSWFVFWYLLKLGFFFSMYKQSFKSHITYYMVLSMTIITCIEIKEKLPFCKFKRSKFVFSDWTYFCTYRFWFVLSIAAFFAPWGFGYFHIRNFHRKHEFNLAKNVSIGTNPFSLYAYSGFLLFPVFIVVLWARHKNILASDLKQITLAEFILGLGLLCNALYNSIVETKLGSIPVEDAVQIRIISALATPVSITSEYENFTLQPYSANTLSRIFGNEKHVFETTFHIHNKEHNIHEKAIVDGGNGKSSIFLIDRTGLKKFGFEPLPTRDNYQRGTPPMVYLLTTLDKVIVTFHDHNDTNNVLKGHPSKLQYTNIQKGTYDIHSTVDGKNESIYYSFLFEIDSVYAILIHDTEENNIRIYQLVNLRILDAMWELPSTIFLTLARYIEAVYAMRFAAFQNPPYVMTIVLSFGINMECELTIGENGILGASMDSGINGSISPTGSQSSQPESLAQAFNSQLCVMTPRMSPVGCSSDHSSFEGEKESDNLVEEVYVAKHSITKGIICADQIESYVKTPLNIPIINTTEEIQLEEIDLNKNNYVEKVVVNVENHKTQRKNDFDVVVSIDIGTTYTGYAFAYVKQNDTQIHMMRQSEGGDRGLNNQKVPTILLLTPEEKFHSFGYGARDSYHDLDSGEAKEWLYFDKFKISLHNNMDVNRDTQLNALNGKSISALSVFSHTLRYLKDQAMKEMKDQGEKPEIRWVITVPALWTQQAKQFVREASYMADICTPQCSDSLLIALEPEAASVCCRNLHFDQIIKIENGSIKSGSYMVVDCGGGTVDITVHNISSQNGTLRELHKATGGPCGSLGIDEEFNKLLNIVFGTSFMERFKHERPAAYNELILSFESRKRSCTTYRSSSLNIFPPFAFIDFFRQISGTEVEVAVKKYGRPELSWSNEGILKIHPSLMYQLFQPTIDKIIEHVEDVLSNRRLDDSISYLFLVGGFSESQILQEAIKDNFSNRVHIIIPQAVSLSVLKGGVLYGMNPNIISSRRVTHTYGLGVVKPFLNGIHPIDKLVIRGGQRWCVDVLERLIESGQPVSLGQKVSKKYTPASTQQSEIVLQVYATVSKTAQFITDPNVHKCGRLRLHLPKTTDINMREIIVSLIFGGTEVTAFAVDSATGQSVHTTLEFML